MTTSQSALAPRHVNESITTMTEHVLPTHANALGTVFGGQILAWIDLCAAICAQRHSRHQAVTAEFDDVTFKAPIAVGQVVLLRAEVTAAFRTSLEILVDVQGEDAPSGRRWPCAQAYVTFVAIEDVGGQRKPALVPPLLLDTDEERRRNDEANERRRLRLARRTRA